jgi:hypothetical protein
VLKLHTVECYRKKFSGESVFEIASHLSLLYSEMYYQGLSLKAQKIFILEITIEEYYFSSPITNL